MTIGEPGALPEVAAIEQQRAALSDVAAQTVDQRLQMGKAAEPAEARGGFFEFGAGEGIGVGAVGADAKALEEGFPDQMRRLARHGADAKVDAGLAEIDRFQLRMNIRGVQDARIAEAFEVVDAGGVGTARRARQAARQRDGGTCLQKIPAAEPH